MLKQLDLYIGYPGNKGHYPNKEYFGSEQYKKDVINIRSTINLFFKNCDAIFNAKINSSSFPIYPVMWSFVFLVQYGNKSYVLIGSSSD